MILSRWQLVLTLTPHLHPLPFSKGRGDPSLAGDAPALQHVLIAFWLRHTNYRYVAPHQEDFLFSCLPDSFGVRSLVRYCTVTSVPTGISEKNLRAVSSGNRMQPCDAG
jgi:hypothetical protein